MLFKPYLMLFALDVAWGHKATARTLNFNCFKADSIESDVNCTRATSLILRWIPYPCKWSLLFSINVGNHLNLLICLYTDPSDLVSADNTLADRGGRKRSKAMSSKSSSSSKARKTSNSDSMTDLSGIGGRDSSLFLFRALGKILYCKRESSTLYQ